MAEHTTHINLIGMRSLHHAEDYARRLSARIEAYVALGQRVPTPLAEQAQALGVLAHQWWHHAPAHRLGSAVSYGMERGRRDVRKGTS